MFNHVLEYTKMDKVLDYFMPHKLVEVPHIVPQKSRSEEPWEFSKNTNWYFTEKARDESLDKMIAAVGSHVLIGMTTANTNGHGNTKHVVNTFNKKDYFGNVTVDETYASFFKNCLN